MGKNAQKFIASDCNLFKVKVLSDAQRDFKIYFQSCFEVFGFIGPSPLELIENRLFQNESF